MSLHRPGEFGSAAAPLRMPPEIGFLLKHGVAPGIVEQAAAIAAQCDVSGDVALLRSGFLGEEQFYRTLAAEAGLPYRPEGACVHAMARFPEAVLSGIVPLSVGDPLLPEFAYAPTGEQIGRLLRARPDPNRPLVIASPTWIRDRLLVARASSIAALAADGLARTDPQSSYRGGASNAQFAFGFACGGLSCAGLAFAPGPTWFGLQVALGCAFLGSTALRLASVLEPVPIGPERPPPRIPDRDLPVYTLLVPLHREGRVLPKLIRALAALDYPAPKLDIKLLLEADDRETAAALADVRLPGFVEVVVAPPGQPRTKPRALNVGLPLARGRFVAVYDAEDVPDPNQLRLAVSIFERSAPDIACLQGRLVIDNMRDGLLTRLFSIEYATLFDVTNPALARYDLPVPLGGTSNHFRTDILQALGGWDAWNVTEDADLGLRLASAGYRVGDLPSATLEEAPRHIGEWLRQRTRWMKGFLQVTITHTRQPLRNWRRLGTARLFGAAAVSLGTVASAFGFPVFMAYAIAEMVSGRMLHATSPAEILLAALGTTLFAAGLLTLLVLPVVAVLRRGRAGLIPLVLAMPLYYCLVSVAAWRGLAELLLAPHRWNKTEHGLARTSLSDGP